MVLHHLLHRLQDEIHLQRFAHGIRQHLFRAGIQDRGQVAEPSVQGDVSNVGQQHGSGAAGLKLPMDQILRCCAHPDGLAQSTVGVRLPDGAGQVIFPYELSDLFHVHTDSHVQEPYMDSTDALGIAPEPIRLQNLLERRPVPFLPELSGPLGTHPVVVPRAGDAGQPAQLLHRQDIAPVPPALCLL